MSHKKSILLAGLPNTGKSTFIAALYHIVQSGEIQGSLKLKSLFGLNGKHLQKLESQWINGVVLERTNIPDEIIAALLLEDSVTGDEVELHIPDMSGETYSQLWEKRSCPKEFISLVEEVSGVLLFIHPAKIKEPSRIQVARRLSKLIAADEIEDTVAVPESLTIDKQAPPPWSAKESPTQTKLIEILQFLVEHMSFPVRLGLIISAWDLVMNEGQTPEDYLKSRLPMLDQFLSSNQEIFNSRVYGISALGGSLETDKNRLLTLEPAERAIIVTGTDKSHDISKPLKWLCG